VNCCISSPPFWALRDYGVDGQLGLEPTFEEYLAKLCAIYDEVKRVLRKDGTCFVNLGDTYSSGNYEGSVHESPGVGAKQSLDYKYVRNDIKPKSLCLIPERFVIEMVNRGWICRNKVIWHKPNPMPSSAKDRFTVDYEPVFFFVKSKKYWFEPQYEPHKNPEFINDKYGSLGEHNTFSSAEGNRSVKFGTKWSPNERAYNPLGRNKRCVWTIPTQAFPEAHFATYPEKLVEPMILSGCPEFVCKKCGQGRRKIYDVNYVPDGNRPMPIIQQSETKANPIDDKCGARPQSLKHGRVNTQHHFKGYTDCGCNAGFRPGIVLDPFAGRARPARLLPRTEGTGLGLNSSRNISKWQCAA